MLERGHQVTGAAQAPQDVAGRRRRHRGLRDDVGRQQGPGGGVAAELVGHEAGVDAPWPEIDPPPWSSATRTMSQPPQLRALNRQ